jgi:hypothetical protein
MSPAEKTDEGHRAGASIAWKNQKPGLTPTARADPDRLWKNQKPGLTSTASG